MKERKDGRVRQRHRELGPAAAWSLYRSKREMSMSKPVPSLLGSTAVASQRGRDDISTEHAPLSRPLRE